jgi:hypothetical protein
VRTGNGGLRTEADTTDAIEGDLASLRKHGEPIPAAVTKVLFEINL